MGVQSIIIFVVVGLVAGYLAGIIWKGAGFGLIGNLIIGVLGAFLGGWLFGHFGIGGGSFIVALILQIIAALVGALIILWIISLVKK
jgi:uncharacterized membrane protein YeaQ/YmgE (transglycosylase-associated protein family)